MNDLLNTRPAMAANPSAFAPISAEALDKTQAAFITAFERELANCGAAATPQLAMRAAAAACRQLLADRWALTQAQDAVRGAAAVTKRVHYLSMEFLMGRALSNALAAMAWRAAAVSPRYSNGSSTFSCAEVRASRLKPWNTKPR